MQTMQVTAPSPTRPNTLSYWDRSRRYRLADLHQLAGDEHQRYEILDGDLLMTPAPGRPHGVVAGQLSVLLQTALSQHKPQWYLMIQPINLDFETDDTTFHCEPDMTLFDRPLEEVASDETLAPVVVIEIVSPSNPENDYVRKVEAYAAMEIPEYWIVDPGNRAVAFLELVETRQGKRYRQRQGSALLPEVRLEPAALFAGLP